MAGAESLGSFEAQRKIRFKIIKLARENPHVGYKELIVVPGVSQDSSASGM